MGGIDLPPGSQKTHDFQLSFNHTSLKRKIKVIIPFKRSFQALSESFLISPVAFCVYVLATFEEDFWSIDLLFSLRKASKPRGDSYHLSVVSSNKVNTGQLRSVKVP